MRITFLLKIELKWLPIKYEIERIYAVHLDLLSRFIEMIWFLFPAYIHVGLGCELRMEESNHLTV